jgi:hypothetical protein
VLIVRLLGVLVLLATVEAVVDDQPADGPVISLDRPRLGAARAVVVRVLDQVTIRPDVKFGAHDWSSICSLSSP